MNGMESAVGHTDVSSVEHVQGTLYIFANDWFETGCILKGLLV